MNIKGLDYNTQRDPLLMPEYGREIQKMIDYAVTIEDKEQRQLCAETIVRMMASRLTQQLNNEDMEQTLWDHLYIMSHKQLDIEWPYDVSNAEKINHKPQPLKRVSGNVRLRHYGRLVEELFEKLKSMPAGEERDALVSLTANQMKLDLAMWGHGSMDDERVASDIAAFTDGVIQLDLNTFVFDKLTAVDNGDSKKRKRK
ncbi:MAG: DUF4290 domain-containing protein [Prevotella sp.]|nr:DUF4290 domain-containing protein [Prevotella sp.]MDD6817877.1 DUF4290 domain-containing protein [Prevotellaceae bacterium]MCI6558808.1 DUF4290 domain-containing protein [Prevotella sp.]MCI7046479.1 DUF4290 domain-containing protein [Prevotella sp.]MDD6842488.1 DUF4290 domain-containing protein [Prevotellaceae bacterium]